MTLLYLPLWESELPIYLLISLQVFLCVCEVVVIYSDVNDQYVRISRLIVFCCHFKSVLNFSCLMVLVGLYLYPLSSNVYLPGFSPFGKKNCICLKFRKITSFFTSPNKVSFYNTLRADFCPYFCLFVEFFLIS